MENQSAKLAQAGLKNSQARLQQEIKLLKRWPDQAEKLYEPGWLE